MDPIDTTDPTERIDDLLGECLERFLPAAPVDDPKSLREFLPTGNSVAARFVLGELIKHDMAACVESRAELRLERYVEALPDLLSLSDLSYDLVIEEYQLRREAGHDPKLTEYAQRFPQHASLLGKYSRDAQTVASTGQTRGPQEFAPGDKVDDFHILQPLGKGAFAQVYLARQQSMQRLVALKVSAGGGDESQALAQFDHENIVRVYDQRRTSDGAVHLLYMQYQPGGTLADVVKRVRSTPAAHRQGQMLLDVVDFNLLKASQQELESSRLRAWIADAPWPVVVAWVGVQLARALGHAHASGVLHRDVKPANVLLSSEGNPKLADFNVSFAGSVGRAGAAARMGGSIGYMAPEHLRAMGRVDGKESEQVSEAADLYSLAVLLWELWQGRRPFEPQAAARNWVEALVGQIASRDRPLMDPTRTGAAGERVLEGTLRRTLVNDPSDRPASGEELAGRLRLALHGEAAEIFDPAKKSFRSVALALPPILLVSLAVLGPNIAAGAFNYAYNRREIIHANGEIRGELLDRFTADFASLATAVNAVAFPLGALLVIYFSWPVLRAMRATKRGEPVSSSDLDSLFALSGRAALIGGSMWAVASVVYPTVLRAWYPSFPAEDAAHFCLSLLVCGGAAAAYPYFLLALLAASIYYPRLVRKSMNDVGFDRRGQSLRREAGAYLIAAAAVPLLAIALLVSRESMAVDVIRVAVVVSMIGLVASFAAYRRLLSVWERMSPVLSPAATSAPFGP